MAWKLIEPHQRARWQIGQIIVKNVKNSILLPKELQGKGFNWYYDEADGIAKMQIEEKSMRKIGVSAGFPKQLRLLFKEEQAVCFYDENALYFSSYKAGDKKLIAFLKQKKIL